ncbi:hypothetical protein HDU93_003393, partial [Gonapodya sp. JEL0774]
MRCPPNSTSCNFKFSALAALLPQGLDLSDCMFGECAYPFENPGYVAASRPIDASQIAGIALGSTFLLLLLALFTHLKLSQRQARSLPPPEPAKGVSLEWVNVTYSVPDLRSPTGSKTILNGLSGIANPGQLTVVMGPSGSGKTTLLDILVMRLRGAGTVEGDVKWAGRNDFTPEMVRKTCGYVHQQDFLPPLLTVRETLLFAARLHLPESLHLQDLLATVNRVLAQLNLEHIAESLIGEPGATEDWGLGGWVGRKLGGKVKGRGISGGERKRVAVGVELVRGPGVLVLD